MAITWPDVSALAPELATAPVLMQTALLARVNAVCPSEVWGDSADYGRVMLAAHLATVLSRRGVGGAPSSQTAGPISQAYSQVPGLVGAFAATSYGTEYQRVLRSLPLARLPIIGGL